MTGELHVTRGCGVREQLDYTDALLGMGFGGESSRGVNQSVESLVGATVLQ